MASLINLQIRETNQFVSGYKVVVSNTQRIVNARAQDGPETKYSGITCELVEEGMHTNMFTILYVSAMPIKRNKLILQLLKNQMADKIMMEVAAMTSSNKFVLQDGRAIACRN